MSFNEQINQYSSKEVPEVLEYSKLWAKDSLIHMRKENDPVLQRELDEYLYDEDDVDKVYLAHEGYEDDMLDAAYAALSQAIMPGRDIEEYLKSRSASRLVYLITDFIPSNPDIPLMEVFNTAGVTTLERQFLDALTMLSERMVNLLTAIYPAMGRVIQKYKAYKQRIEQEVLDRVGLEDPLDYTNQEMLDGFSKEPGTFRWAGSNKFKDTGERIESIFREYERANTPPTLTLPWEMRIGASKFSVPPINVNVYQAFKTGSLSGGALRQMNTPKFNSGHSETIVEVTLYYPNQESVWGFEGDSLTIDLLDPTVSDEVLDRYLSSLRGLVTQFKYAPFLPVKNQYLNQVYDITAVALQSMTVSTMENFPFCLTVTLQMQKFNHKVFLPTIRDFNTAIHWGRFRQYMTAAAQQINKVVNRGFLVRRMPGEGDFTGPVSPNQVENYHQTERVEWEYPEQVQFNKAIDFDEGRHFEIYFPERTPAKVFMPEYSMFRAEGEDDYLEQDLKEGWGKFLQDLGYSPTDHSVSYDRIKDQKLLEDRTPFPASDKKLLSQFLVDQSPDEWMKIKFLENWKEYYRYHAGPDDVDIDDMDYKAAEIWFNNLFNTFIDQDYLEKYQKDRRESTGEILIREWMIPMAKIEIDWNKVFVTGISTTIGNNFAKLQLQMEEDPVLQHIGGLDSQVNVNMVVFGESELIKWKRMFSHVNGLAMLEHAHGVLGFLGIKNIVTALCGIKYVLPLDFSIETVTGFPNVYNVTMSFVDFDVEQQKREELSNEQQRMLTEQFSKRNPFLRIKQMWGAFNAYPDMPLAVTDDAGNVVGHLDPDYYFRAFDTWDDDLLKHSFSSGRTMEDVENQIDDTRQNFRGLPRLGGPERDVYDRQMKDLYYERDVYRYFQIKNELELFDQTYPNMKTSEANAKKQALKEERDAIIGRLGGVPISPSIITEEELFSGSTAGNVSRKIIDEHKVRWAMGVFNEEQSDIGVLDIMGERMTMATANKNNSNINVVYDNIALADQNADRTNNTAFTEGLTPLGEYQSAYTEYGDSFVSQYEQIAYDARYRDVSGRMIRAFPTYMLWLIDEGGRFAGVKLFDNFYGLQSVIDFSVVQSEDILGDTLVLRLSNLYKKLTTPANDRYIFGEQGEEEKSGLNFINTIYRDIPRNVNSGTLDNYLVDLNSVRLRPGVRLHLRMGYGSNPNALQTVFNGTITSVTAGEIVEVVAQSDAIELSAIVNTTNTKGDTSDIDGSMFTGMWLSEPRDLMVRLLSMGTSQWREYYANATQGKIFSENKWGIRHFGSILYEPMSDEEKEKNEKQAKSIDDSVGTGKGNPLPDSKSQDPSTLPMDESALPNPDSVSSEALGAIKGSASAIRFGAVEAIRGLFRGLDAQRDIEIFKRNIYPGNGTGIAQYLGADTLNGGDILAGADPDLVAAFSSQVFDTEGNDKAEAPRPGIVSMEDIRDSILAQDAFATSAAHGYEVSSGNEPLVKYRTKVFENSPIMRMLGITSGDDDDVKGHDEVSFRASTYMKSIWDLFQVCAGLLPNYVVAVRPFEDRSTVFYGKPHWLYTSGVIPLSTGVPNDGSSGPKETTPDSKTRELLEKLADMSSSLSDSKKQLDIISNSAQLQEQVIAGAQAGGYVGGEGTSELTTTYNGREYKLSLPFYDPASGKDQIGVEMHLPTNGEHKQMAGLPEQYKYPFYMDRKGGVRGGYTKIYKVGEAETVLGERASETGQPGAFGVLDPDEEQFYINMRWDYADGPPDPLPKDGRLRPPQAAYKYQRILVINNETNMACVCAVGEYGPWMGGVNKGVVGGASPDVHLAIGNVDFGHVSCRLSWLPPGTPLGPTTGGTAVERGPISANQAERNAGTGSSGGGNTPSDPTKTPIETTEREVFEVADFYVEAYEHYSKGWLESTNPWHDPWGSEYGDVKPVDFINNINDDIYTNRVLEVLIDWFKRDKDKGGLDKLDQATKEAQYIRGEGESAAIEDLLNMYGPFGPDPVSIAARRYYDAEYNERLSLAEQELVAKNVAGFSVKRDVYNISSNFTTSDGAPLEEGRGKSAAEIIWKNFRKLWLEPLPDFQEKGDDDYAKEIERDEIREVFEMLKNPGINGVTIPKSVFTDPRLFTLDKDDKDEFMQASQQGPALVSNEAAFRRNYNRSVRWVSRVVHEFVEFMWKDPYARAWLVITTQGNDSIDIPRRNQDDDNYHFGESLVTDALAYYLSIRKVENGAALLNAPPSGGKLNEVQGQMLGWLRQNNQKGRGVSGLDDIVKEAVDNVGENIGKIWRAISIGFSGLFSIFEQAIGSYGEAFERVMAMQRRSNVLNAAYNDSIYYAAGPPGSLMRLADNPFTREYGEPVVEVREPFQRLHYFNSFQHILANNIQENLDTIYTTMTVTSDGKYPITVFFDKGAPPDRQVEGFAETGLFWDNAKGSGFFGFMQPLFHPIETLRGLSKIGYGSSDELSAKRIGIYHLKESLKDIYRGELTVLGSADVRPWDLVYIGDVYERMYGLFEVEQVVHHFTPETGFITAITPNALAMANDPGRWSALSWLNSWMGIKNIRDDVRHMVTRAPASSPLVRGESTLADLISTLSPQVKGQIQYTHGSSSLVKDLMGHLASGYAYKPGEYVDQKATSGGGFGSLLSVAGGYVPIFNMFHGMAWDFWEWTKDTLADQQDCYISYLTKDGKPMDAGLSYNSGVAVGTHHSYTLLPGILGFDFDTAKDGHRRITIEDLLGNLGYNEHDIISIRRNTSLWISRVNARVLQYAGAGPDDLPFVESDVITGTVEDIIDADTIRVSSGAGSKDIRLSGVAAPELAFYTSSGAGVYDSIPLDDPGRRAKEYVASILPIGSPVAVRFSARSENITFNREAGVIFHNAPVGLEGSDKIRVLEQYASQQPMIPWDSYLDDGRPHTLNWELIMAGHSPVNYEIFVTYKNRSGEGASGINPNDSGG